ncbi:hypothetical protein PFICI_13455 [Pestalotiopsis fici W106-1]|uniref:Heterokaryon incompatibility domain-containing protein n=1 Tax=Pestalotiopsis fici (strain W106-1 / CGMCC3.15140) TaxID=1229662 RepID=W3WQ65_PESFW|nr:uncharacterized protein PFICI_13455 [Pestalotiopsis fici W106-1]ETS74971.1 hypothetical protein PFICI_13455 [Pestalotiopsis fici W106-1]
MWLLDTETQQLHPVEFFEHNRPRYAILTHRWRDDEVMFADMGNLDQAKTKASWPKIRMTCEKARSHGLKYAWVDSCCIDKSSSAELSEAINSMWHWYLEATECYAFLDDCDLSSTTVPFEEQLRASEWFRRGWTLQELIAPGPDCFWFYDKRWNKMGDKSLLSSLIANITSIPQRVLLDPHAVSTYSIAQRMSWASQRQTTRIEDTAYCLLGIFGINMPLLYGERERAFLRLQEELIKKTSDLTLLAWESSDQNITAEFCDVFASSPSVFANSGQIKLAWNEESPQWTLTSKGLEVYDEIYQTWIGGVFKTLWWIGSIDTSTRQSFDDFRNIYGRPFDIHLVFVELDMIGPGIYVRTKQNLLSLSVANWQKPQSLAHTRCQINTLSFPNLAHWYTDIYRLYLKVPRGMQIVGLFPEKYSNFGEKFLFKTTLLYVHVILIRISEGDDVICLVDSHIHPKRTGHILRFRMLNRRQSPLLAEAILQRLNVTEVLSQTLTSVHPEVTSLIDSTLAKVRGQTYVVSA